MGLIGKYLDALPDHARDRVIEAQDWCFGWAVMESGRCLVGHAEDWEGAEMDDDGMAQLQKWRDHETREIRQRVEARFNGVRHLRHYAHYQHVAQRFDKMAARLGVEEAVRLVKARAGGRSGKTHGTRKGAEKNVAERREEVGA